VKDLVSVATFAIAMMCFVSFLNIVRPAAPFAVQATSAADPCQTSSSVKPGCGLHLFAAVSEAVVRRQ
jgi:hypothetical protein